MGENGTLVEEGIVGSVIDASAEVVLTSGLIACDRVPSTVNEHGIGSTSSFMRTLDNY